MIEEFCDCCRNCVPVEQIEVSTYPSSAFESLHVSVLKTSFPLLVMILTFSLIAIPVISEWHYYWHQLLQMLHMVCNDISDIIWQRHFLQIKRMTFRPLSLCRQECSPRQTVTKLAQKVAIRWGENKGFRSVAQCYFLIRYVLVHETCPWNCKEMSFSMHDFS